MNKKRGSGDGSIMERSDGRWQARLRYTDPLTRVSKRIYFYARDRKAVVDKLDEARRRLRADKPPADESIRLCDFLDLWLEDVVKPTKREYTSRQYGQIIDNHLIPKLGGRRLRDLREVEIQHVLVAASKATPRIQQLCLIVLRRALAQAVKWQMLDANPAKDIEPPRIERKELRVLSPAQARAFLKELQEDRLYALFLVALNTGLRQGELLALEWRDVDLARGSIAVVRTLNTATGKVGPPKTKSSRRRVDIDDSTVAVVKAHKVRMESEGHHGPLVFPSTRGTPLNPSNVRTNTFLPAQRRAKIHPPVRFHDLRHTAATLMLGAGVHAKVASERLGHATVAITMDVYQHVSLSMQRDAARKVSGVLLPVKRGGCQKRVSNNAKQKKLKRKTLAKS